MKKEELLKLYQSYRLYIFPAIIGLSSLILIVFIIYPQMAKLISNQKVEEEFTIKSNFLEAKAQTLGSYDPADLERKVNIAVGSYPVDKDFISAVSLLQSIVTEAGFNISSISLGSGLAKSTGSQSYSIKLDLTGQNSLLPTLLNKIENSSRVMKVGSVETVIAKDGNAATVALSVDVLYSSAPSSFGSVESPLPELSAQEEEVIAKLATVDNNGVNFEQSIGELGPRGKANPFE